jgi:collagenase-like PrtC family protease
MEILSPAGFTEQIKTAVQSGANAVYGGFSYWNARNNAVNLTVKQYNESITLLHNNGLKFYLTLNTLLLNDEIQQIIDFLHSGEVQLPDAFIVADLGLIITLRKEFPDISIHISTQFGIHSIADVRLAEELGAERVILARELSINEVDFIRHNTSLEIECFVWGSQCISFSGLCYFGALIHGGSGNRGKCTIVCRDKFSCDSVYGNIFYITDMNCNSSMSYYSNNNLFDSAKIEGRRRECSEIKKTIEQILSSSSEEPAAGYLCYESDSKSLPLHQCVHNRIPCSFQYLDHDNWSQYDVFVLLKNNGERLYIDSSSINSDNNRNVYYVFTEYESYELNKYNIYMDFSLKNNVLYKVNFTNHKGEFKTFEIENCASLSTSGFSIDEFVDMIQKNYPSVNVARIKFTMDSADDIRISTQLSTIILTHIQQQYSNRQQLNQTTPHHYPPLSELYVETSNISLIDSLIKYKSIHIIFDLTSVKNLQNMKALLDRYGDKLIYKLPIFDWENSLHHYLELFSNKCVMFTRFAQILQFRDLPLKKRYVDYTCHAWNDTTIDWLRKNGIDMFSTMPELSYSQNSHIFRNVPSMYTFAGKLPLVLSRHCFKDILHCTHCGQTREVSNDDKQLQMELKCLSDHRRVYFKNPILNDVFHFALSPHQSFRYVVSDESIDEVNDTINIILHENDFCEVLKSRMNLWMRSYESNLYEGCE